ncbi:MAG TPA: cation:proton antiporter [Ktedonobacterales bacterium]|nr:cation:proton antiporter [Ktedonobacterales bacterium]
MQSLSENQLLFALLGIAAILLVGRGTAELARRIGQPEVLGELLGGVLLGPSVVGALFPGAYKALYLTPEVSTGLSLLSWIGAILLLMIAGLEVDLGILRANVRPGMLAAALAIVPSIAAGTIFAALALGRPPDRGVFLGLVLSVTAVSVVAKLLIERDALRRTYAQVIIAAGVASEVLVWLLIAVVSALHGGSPVASGIRATLFAIGFFVLMMTLGRRFTNWAMRRTADLTQIVNGELSLVLALVFISASLTQALELHALLGAFVFGVLLSQAPRATARLKERIQTLTVGFFAPIFFVLAGMRVDIFKLGALSSLWTILLLFVVATAVKVGMGALGARLGGLRGWESALVGVGLNLKGGTDVIVAILGVQLGLLSVQTYTIYAVVAILTVAVSPPVLALLERRVPPSREEMARLNREEARRRAYLPHLERVLVPLAPDLQPQSTAWVVEALARAKEQEGEVFDIMQLQLDGAEARTPTIQTPAVSEAKDRLDQAGENATVELTKRTRDAESHPAALHAILDAADEHVLIVFGAHPPIVGGAFTLGDLQDRITDRTTADVLAVVTRESDTLPPRPIRRILVPVNGFEYSMAAGDVAGYLAKATGAELVLFTTVRSRLDSLFWRERGHRELLKNGYQVVRELAFRVGRLGIRAGEHVEVGEDAGEAIVRELARRPYDLIVMGAVDRSTDDRLYLGSPVEMVLGKGSTPTLLLVTHEQA